MIQHSHCWAYTLRKPEGFLNKNKWKLRNFKMEFFCSEIQLTLEQVRGWGCWPPSVVQNMRLALSTHSYISMDSTNLGLCSTVVHILWKNTCISRTRRDQTHFDQGSTEAAQFFSFYILILIWKYHLTLKLQPKITNLKAILKLYV